MYSPCVRIGFLCAALVAIPVSAATVTIEPVLNVSAGSVFPATSTPGVPGRAANIVFRGDNPIPPPAINDAGDFVFRARSALNTDTNNSTAFGIYAKRVGFPLSVLVDTTEASPGVPTFAVPGRPANNRFASFRPPIMNNVGDVVFQATFSSPGTTPSSGTGIYTVKITGGPIMKITDTFTAVPNYPTALFNSFDPGLLSVALTTVVNDMGQIAYWGQFLIPGNATQRTGLFGATIAGGAGVRLADSVGASGPVSVPVGVNAFFNEIRYAVAMNNPGTVVFSAGMPGGATNRGGVYVVPVTGGPINTVAIRGQAVPGRAGQTFQDTFEPGGHNVDINDAGVVLFRNQYQLSSPFDTGAYSAVASGPGFVHTRVFDTGPGLTIPGEPAGAEFSGFVLPSINESNVISPFSRVSPGSPTPNQQGIYYTDSDGSPFSVIANLNTAPPGQPAPVGGFPRFSNFIQTNGALGALNETGNLTFLGSGNPTPTTGFRGIYFYDVCTPELFRISDSTISLAQLGGVVNNDYDIWQVESHAGMYRSINNLNDVAFAAQFTNFDYGLYIAHITTGSGGQLNITCPSDVTAECPADGGVAGNGTATATGCGTITMSSGDVSSAGCGGTVSISRTWTADNGSTAASCVQTIAEVDTTGPVLSGVPSHATVQCNALPPTPTVTALDGCEGTVAVTLSESQAAGSCPGTYVLTRTWTATDGCNNSTSASQDVAVMDSFDPVLVGVPGDVAVECDAVPDPAEVTGSDTCDTTIPVAFVESQTNGSCPDEYTLTRSWTAVDDCGNDVTAVQFVSVDDTTPPTVLCPAHATLECPADTSVLANGSAAGSDNCSTPSISSSDTTAQGCGTTLTVTRTWTATDECSNAATCDQFVAIVDTTPPHITCPPNATHACPSDTSVAANGSASGADDCGTATITSSDVLVAGCGSTLTVTRTWTATDDCGNAASCDQTITTVDTSAPSVNCPANATGLECPVDTSIAARGSATANDNCGAATISSSDISVSGCGETETITRTWSATDECSNTASCNQTITTVDTTPPVITVETTPITIVDSDCSGSQCVVLPMGTATDDCDSMVLVAHDAPTCAPPDMPIADAGDHGDDDDDGDDDDEDDEDDDPPSPPCNGFCFPAGDTTVTYTATDDCENIATATRDVTVRHGAHILVIAKEFIVGAGHHPHVSINLIAGLEVGAYLNAPGSCARNLLNGNWGILKFALDDIIEDCVPTATGVTNSQGRVTLDVPPGDYVIAAHWDSDNDGDGDEYLGDKVHHLTCGETEWSFLVTVRVHTNKRHHCKWYRYTGSELVVLEPEEIVWDGTEQLYPFVFDSVGDWGVTVSVAPPEGFVADHGALSEEVTSEVEAVQFTITEVGSDLVPTQTAFAIRHKGETKTLRSSIGIKLTPDYAKSRGFDVDELRRKGLIVEKVDRAIGKEPLGRNGVRDGRANDNRRDEPGR